MEITFLVGNGFDISCGIKSSYRDFYEWYCKQEKSEKDHVNTFRQTIDEDIKAGKKNWADFEEALGKYTSHFTKSTASDFIDCFEDAHEKLMDYLEEQTEQFESELSDEAIKQMRKGLKEFYSELTPKERIVFDTLFASHKVGDSIIRFISFNYTYTLDKCISQISQEPLDVWNTNNRRCTFTVSPTVLHIHGELEKHPIFGVNDETQIENKALLEVRGLAQLMIKSQSVEIIGQLWHEKAKKMINDSNIICIYGMSMGITDTIWFSQIMDWLKANDSRQLIIFWHTNSPSNGRSVWKFWKNKQEARERITDFSDLTDEQIEQLSLRIHIIENSKNVLRVKLKEATETPKTIVVA